MNKWLCLAYISYGSWRAHYFHKLKPFLYSFFCCSNLSAYYDNHKSQNRTHQIKTIFSVHFMSTIENNVWSAINFWSYCDFLLKMKIVPIRRQHHIISTIRRQYHLFNITLDLNSIDFFFVRFVCFLFESHFFYIQLIDQEFDWKKQHDIEKYVYHLMTILWIDIDNSDKHHSTYIIIVFNLYSVW